MTRKHFQLIADAINSLPDERNWYPDDPREFIARRMAMFLKSTNGRFDVERFVRACLSEK